MTAAPTLDIVDAVKAEMRTFGLEPSPSNYDLLYTKLEGSDPDVLSAFEQIRAAGGSVDEATMRKIGRICGRTVSRSRFAEMTKAAHAQIDGIRTSIAGGSASMAESGAAIAAGIAALPADIAGNPEVARIATAAAGIASEAERMNKSLEDARAELDSMRSELDATRAEAATDGLTGLPNRRSLDGHLKTLHARAKRNDAPFSIAICDVDHFKSINDTHGHPVGDQVLQELGKAFAAVTGGSDGAVYAGRYGGEEFLVVAEGKTAAEAAAIIDAMRREMAARNLTVKATGKPLGRITFSTGVASFPQRKTVSAVLKSADAALYRAKRDGRNQVCVAYMDE